MPRSDWLRNAAIGLIGASILTAFAAWGAWSLVEYQNDHTEKREKAAAYQTEHSAKQGESLCVQIPGKRASACVTNPPDTDANAKYTEYDLRAQQDMAEWAFVMVLVGLAGLGATVAGLIYIIRAYNLNASATDYARIAAEAATQQTKIAQQTLAAERRPWVAIDDVGLISFFYEPVNGRIAFDTLVTLRNTGQSPALDVFLSLGATASMDPNEPKRLQDEMRAQIKRLERFPAGVETLFPGSPPRPHQHGVSIERDDFERLRERWRQTFPEGNSSREGPMLTTPSIYGVVAYRSPYDSEVHTTCFIVNYSMKDGKAMRIDQQNPANGLPTIDQIQGRQWINGWEAD
jgi:hypothetical protein